MRVDFKVSADAAGQRLDKFLRGIAKDHPSAANYVAALR